MSYTKKQFLEDVAKEAKALKKHATKKELGRLEFHLLNPISFQACVYGLMTKDCRSERASELIHTCCPRYFENVGRATTNSQVDFKDGIQCNVNGNRIDGVNNPEDLRYKRNSYFKHFSAIETYILYKSAKHKNLIDFLKGERKDLVL